MRDRIAEIISAASAIARTPVIAFTVMPNHLHLIVRQASAPLAWLMHRVLHRTALAVKKVYHPDGHVFGARFYSGMCEDGAHARQAIIYTHLNAYYAGLCAHPREYRWSSYHHYVATTDIEENSDIAAGLRLFASHDGSDGYARENHELHIAYWMERKRLTLGEKYVVAEHEPLFSLHSECGDTFWKTHCAGDVVSPPVSRAQVRTPVADRAVALLAKLDPAVPLDYVRMCGRGRLLSTVRRELIAALLSCGYSGAAIARCLNVSGALVSSVRLEVEQASFQ